MAEIASALLLNLLEKLSAKAFEEISLAWYIKGDIQKLQERMKAIEMVVLDAEEKQHHSNQVSHWLRKLRNVLYDVEDVLAEFECEAERRKVMKQLWSTRRKVLYFFYCKPIIFNFKMAHRIREVNGVLNDINKGINEFSLVEKKVDNDFSPSFRETHSYVNPSYVLGRDEDREWIIQKLLHSDIDKELSVISLVGMGGLGKTTLAQLVYNDQRVKEYFSKQLWICVSEDFDLRRLIKKILSSGAKKDATLEELQLSLRQMLSDKKFLLVLDDVWNEERSKWEDLKPFLEVGAKGSKILVTTRMYSVAKIMSKDELTHKLKGLNKDDSWCFFAKCAFGDKKEDEIPYHLRKIGETIIEKCKGVPLAVKSLGSLLHSQINPREWEYVRDNEIWKLKENDDGILPALKLSYRLMPSYLKPCFVYCALFPQDYEYNTEDVIYLWMANGMLHSRNESEELEDIGRRYFEELHSRSLFQTKRPGLFTMHDLVHDLARSIAEDKYFNSKSKTKTIPESVHHIYLPNPNKEDDTIVPQQLPQLKNVRSFILEIRPYGGLDQCYFAFNKYLFLRVLKMSRLRCKWLPHKIGELKHLRYLMLVDCALENLPDSIGELQSLQTLKILYLSKLKALPKNMKSLINLRHLSMINFRGTLRLDEILEQVKCLCNLRCLNIKGFPKRTDLNDDEDGINQKFNPRNLRALDFVELEGLRSIPVWFQSSANTLREVLIYKVDIVALPDWFSKLTTLETLILNECRRLSSLPEGFECLSNLQTLKILNCGDLSRRCKPEGEEWHKIAHIPTIEIDYKLVKRG